jgi:uncharacterized protein DUF4142
MQVSAHKDAVDLFERYANGGDNADLKAWAGKTLPALKHHLDDGAKPRQAGGAHRRRRKELTSFSKLLDGKIPSLARFDSRLYYTVVRRPPRLTITWWLTSPRPHQHGGRPGLIVQLSGRALHFAKAPECVATKNWCDTPSRTRQRCIDELH